jgi:Na+-transporting methylmalonyl-CoA/oxaloacetate decarboxylase gamma subunit
MQEIIISGLQIALIGISVVFVALALVAFLVKNLDLIDRAFSKKPAVEAAPVASPSPSSPPPKLVPPVDGAMPQEVIAVISAAVAVALGEKARVTHIQRHQPGATWRVQGRSTIMSSHQVKK